MVLEPIPTERLVECFKLAMTTRSDKSASFPVNAQEIFNAWKALHKPVFRTSGEAWAIACNAVRNAPVSYSGSEPRRLMPEIDDALIAKCVRSIGPDVIALNERDDARKRFDWMYRAEVGQEQERIEIDPGHQLPENRQALIPEVSGMLGQVAKRLESNPDDRPTPEEVKAMFENARASVVSRKVN